MYIRLLSVSSNWVNSPCMMEVVITPRNVFLVPPEKWIIWVTVFPFLSTEELYDLGPDLFTMSIVN